MTRDEARGFLLSGGFNVSEFIQPGGGEPGLVYKQSPDAGTVIPTGGTVAIWIQP